jgi:N-dimethylarginine dimethylaminohydrolase
MIQINKKLLMSGADYFDDRQAINAYMDDRVQVDVARAVAEHNAIQGAFRQAGIDVVTVPPPVSCQDGVYTANWALISGQKAIMSNLPNARQPESPYAEKTLRELGYEIVRLPLQYAFSGQGDALPCGKYLFVGSMYRTHPTVHDLLAKETGLNVIGLQTIPERDIQGQPIINKVSGWPDSFFYDLDLALAVITPQLIAWCPEAFVPESQAIIRALPDVEKIEVSYQEATEASACNLVSTGDTVIMGSKAPVLKAQLESKGLRVTTLDVTELMKGGGFIRCTSLSLY